MTKRAVPLLVPVTAGRFCLGSEISDAQAEANEKPRHLIDLPAFQISKYPITNQEYAGFITAMHYEPPDHWRGTTPPPDLLDHPVVNVQLKDCQRFCEWLSQETGVLYELPSEEQWEKAARGPEPEKRPYVWGDAWKPNVCNTIETEIKGTTAVHHFENTNISLFGAVDMLGNVWEWTRSWYLPYAASPHDSLRYGSYRVIRGGSWDNDHHLARISCRGRYKPDVKRPYLGFRIVTNVIEKPVAEETRPPGPKTEAYDRVRLLENIVNHFSQEELKTLAFELHINSDSFTGNIQSYTRQLIEYCEHRQRIPELRQILSAKRPQIDW